MPVRVPPPQIPIISWLTPNKTDQGLLEFWNTENADYVPLDIGAAHPNARQYPNFKLGKQSPVQGDEKWTLRIWVTDETNPDWFNWAEKFAGEDAEFPTFIRTYREPRATYTPRTKGEPLSTLYKLVVTDAGSGYTNGTYPNIVFDAPTVAPTSEATAHGVIAPDGTISECVLDFGGDGYEQDVEFHVDPPINGNPAAGIAYVQPQIAILTREEAQLYPEDSPFYAQYLQVIRIYETIPGPTFNETRLDIDGAELDVATTRKFCEDIDTGETIVSGTWCKTTSKPTDIDVICEEVVECRSLPGNLMVSTKIEEDGNFTTRTQNYIDTSTGVSSEAMVGSVWTKKYIEDVDGTNLVSWQWVETRDLDDSNPIVKTIIDDAGDELEETRLLVEYTDITTTITTAGGVYTKTFQDPVSDLVAWKVEQVKPTQNELDSFEVSIPDLIPREFSGSLPVTETGQTLIGLASLPTLVAGDLSRGEAQIDFNTYRLTIRGRAGLMFPITVTNQETTEEYGGGILNVTLTLDDSLMVPDEGLLVVSSEVITLGGGLFLKTTKELDDSAWTPIASRLWDENYRVEYDETRQVVAAGTAEDPDPGGVFAWVSEVKAIDKWRSWLVNTSKPTPDYDSEANALQSYEYKPYRFPGLLYYATSTTPFYVRHADAVLVQHLIKTWWLKSTSTPTVTITGGGGDVEIDEIIMDDVVIATLNDIRTLTYSGPVLHDDMQIGALFYPATTPSYTQYALGTPTGTTTVEIMSLYYPGTAGGYMVGDTITVSGGGFSASTTVTAVYDVDTITGLIGALANPASGTFPAGNYGPFTGSGGSGTGALFNVTAIVQPTYTPGTQWIGTYRVVGAAVTPEREKDVWKIVTESVVMR